MQKKSVKRILSGNRKEKEIKRIKPVRNFNMFGKKNNENGRDFLIKRYESFHWTHKKILEIPI